MTNPLAALSMIKGAKVEENVPLSSFTTWKVGGPAKFFVWVSSERSVLDALAVARECALPVFPIGNGSNVLVSEEGFSGVALRLSGELETVETGQSRLAAGAGAPLGLVVREAVKASLSGFEFAVGIPGTVGGAVMTNAGAFSGSMAGVIEHARAAAHDGELLDHESFKDLYRSPLVPENQVVTTAAFRLVEERPQEIRKRMSDVADERREKQPWGLATAGSVFKNPPGDAAGRLIDSCGLKGRAVGGARVSEIHANFIINEGGASSGDIKTLMDIVAREVYENFGINLEPEVRLVGFEEE